MRCRCAPTNRRGVELAAEVVSADLVPLDLPAVVLGLLPRANITRPDRPGRSASMMQVKTLFLGPRSGRGFARTPDMKISRSLSRLRISATP